MSNTTPDKISVYTEIPETEWSTGLVPYILRLAAKEAGYDFVANIRQEIHYPETNDDTQPKIIHVVASGIPMIQGQPIPSC